jgi:hypothetical protein
VDEFSLITLNSTHAARVSKLRKDAYLRHYGARADLDRLNWNSNDERFLNIGLIRKQDQTLISVMRLAYLRTPIDFYKVVLLEHSPRFELPLVVFGRAATAEESEGRGLHGVLRWSALKLSRAAGAKACVGTLEEGSRRLQQMAEIGYEFFPNNEPWHGYLKNEKPIVVGRLTAGQRLDDACEILSKRFRDRKILFDDRIDYAIEAQRLRETNSFVSDE